MSGWTSDRVARVLDTAPTAACSFGSVSTDTRTLERGALFVALIGERFDGHAFLAEAERRGARGAVVRGGTAAPDGLAVFEVDDTLRALGLLAADRRHEIPGPVVAVTGTNGKTATKEMLAAVLSTRWRTHATRGNLNNLIGVPLTILSAPEETECLVAEAGANLPGEIRSLRDVIDPTVGVITNVSMGHLEGFGSLDQVLYEKLSLVEGLPLAILGTEPPALADRARALAKRIVVAGTDARADVGPEAWGVGADGRPFLSIWGARVTLPVLGGHQVDNALLALATAQELGLGSEAVTALESVRLPPGRCALHRRGDLLVLHDAYNANPGSIAAALETARAMRGDRPLVVLLGSMLELGPDSARLHRAVADRVMSEAPRWVGAVGEFVPAFAPHAAALGDRLLTADDPATLGEQLARRLDGDEFVLVKGSRGVQMERALPHLLSDDDG